MFLRLDRSGRSDGLKLRPTRGRVLLSTAGVVGLTLLLGCGRDAMPKEAAHLSWTLSPDPPRTGPATLALSLEGLDSKPI